MEFRKISVKTPNPAAYNPRVPLKSGDPRYEKIKASIKGNGNVCPLVWNEDTGNLVSGHQRLNVLIEMGYEEIDVSVVHKTLEEEKLLNLALNADYGEWDYDKLGDLLEELSKKPELDTSFTGFSVAEISEVLDQIKKLGEDTFDFEADLESGGPTITQPNELIQLGDHFLMQGDSANSSHVAKLLQGNKIKLVVTDPPYRVFYYGGNRPHANARPKKCKNWVLVYQDNLSQEDYEKMLEAVFSNMDKHLAPGSAFYIFNGHAQFGPMHLMLARHGYHISTVIVWAKPNFSISYGDYHQQVEFCLYGWKEDNGAHFWAGPTNESTLWEIARDSSKDLIHATQKPIALAQRAIRNSSKRGDVIGEFFAGSGSTIIAAETLERHCFAMEYEARHCDAIVRRFIKFAPHKVSEEIKSRYLAGAKNGD